MAYRLTPQVVQERYLSRRKILFCHDQIFWECQGVTASEDGLNYATTAFQVEKLWTAEAGYTNWYKLVSEYSFCRLTYESDVFAALTGLTNCLLNTRDTGPQCCAGLWTDDIARGLAWKLKCHRTTMFQDKCSAACKEVHYSFRKKTDHYQAPTFSWAAWRSGVAYDYAHNANAGTATPGTTSLVQYVSHSLQQTDSPAALAGPYNDGWLHLRGLLLPVLQHTQMTAVQARRSLFQPTTQHEIEDCMELVCSSGPSRFVVYGSFDDPKQSERYLWSRAYILPLLRDDSRVGFQYLTFLIVQRRGSSKSPMRLARLGIGRSIVEEAPCLPPHDRSMLRVKRPFSEAWTSGRDEIARKRIQMDGREAAATEPRSAMDLMLDAPVTDLRLL
jgi:hypothetical protein